MSQISIFLKNFRELIQKDQDLLRHELGERHDRAELRLDAAEPRLDHTERRIDIVEPRIDEAEKRIDSAVDKSDATAEELAAFKAGIDGRLGEIEKSLSVRFDALTIKLEERLDSLEAKLDGRVDTLTQKVDLRLDDYEAAVDERFEARFGDFSSRQEQRIDDRHTEIETRNDAQLSDLTADLMGKFESHTRALDLRVDDRLSSVERASDKRMSSFEQGIDLRLFNREKYVDDRLVRIGDDIVARTDLLLQHSDDRVDRLRQAMRALTASDGGGVGERLEQFDALKASRRALEDIHAAACYHFEGKQEDAKAHYFKIIEWKREAQEALLRFSADEKEIADYILSFVDRSDPKHEGYAQTHLRRFIATLGRIPPPQKSTAKLLELGSCFFFTPAIERFAGYSKISCADWHEGAKSGVETIEVRQRNGKEVHEFETRLFNAETDAFPYTDGSFQVVLCCEMLEHLSRDPMHLFVEANRVLENGGLILVTTPNITSIRAIEGLLTGYPPYLWMKYNLSDTAQQHYHEHTPETVRIMLESAGFKIEELETEDVWAKSNPATVDLLKELKFSAELRGDNIFALARKAGPPLSRYPESLYVQTPETSHQKNLTSGEPS